MAHLRRLLCCSSLALVAAKRRSPSERTLEGAQRPRLLSRRGDADPERYYNASWTPGPPQAWNSTRRLTSTNLIDPAAHAVTSLPACRPTGPAATGPAWWTRTTGRAAASSYWLFEKKESGPAPVILAQWRARLLEHGAGLFGARAVETCATRRDAGATDPRRELAPRGPRAVRRPARGHWVLQNAACGYCKNDQCIVDQFETFLARLARSHPDLLLKRCRDVGADLRRREPRRALHPVDGPETAVLRDLGITWDVKGAALATRGRPLTSTTQREQRRKPGISPDQASRIVVKEKSCQAKLRGARAFPRSVGICSMTVRVTRASGRIGLGANQYDAATPCVPVALPAGS